MQVPFVFSSNGDGFLFHDRTLTEGKLEQKLSLDEFPSPAALWARHTDANGIPTARLPLMEQGYNDDGSGREPRYYQETAINRTVEAIAQAARTASCSSWPPAPARPTSPFRSSGGFGKRA